MEDSIGDDPFHIGPCYWELIQIIKKNSGKFRLLRKIVGQKGEKYQGRNDSVRCN